MPTHDETKAQIRPILSNVTILENMSLDEKFQNITLRPILKMQHDLIVVLVEAFFKMKKNAFYKLSSEKRLEYLKKDLLSDQRIIYELRGMVIGLFTLEELKYYLKNKSAINKRMQSLLLQRIRSFTVC